MKNQPKNLLVFLALIVFGVGGYLLGSRLQHEQATAIGTSRFPTLDSYTALAPQDCQNRDTADATACVWRFASSTAYEADILAEQLVSGNLGHPGASVSGYPIFGGEGFASDLSMGVRQAEKTRQSYIETICKLDSMTLYGGSGIDLEQGACEYYNQLQYLTLLKHLRGTEN